MKFDYRRIFLRRAAWSNGIAGLISPFPGLFSDIIQRDVLAQGNTVQGFREKHTRLCNGCHRCGFDCFLHRLQEKSFRLPFLKLIGLESIVNYTVFVPLTVKSGKYARQLLEKALNFGLEPTPHPAHPSNLRKLSLYLLAILTAQVEAHPSSLSRSDLIRGLVSAAENYGDGQSIAAVASEARKWNLHRAQEEMVDTLIKGINAKKITLLEGSTGIGKSRVIAKTALQLPSSTKIGIFAPTLAVLYQLVEEFLKTAKPLKIGQPSIALYLGKRNFVDLHKLEEILSILEPSWPEAAARAKAWIEQGGPTTTKISQLLKKHVPVQWLVHDLIEIVPEISASSVSCDDLSKPLPGLEAYQKAREGVNDAQIIFSTHTMLCLSALNTRSNRPSLFPYFGTVFLDEAHQLEEAMANCTGSELSLRHIHGSLRDGFKRKDVSPKRWHAIDSLLIKCQQELALLPDGYLLPAGVKAIFTISGFAGTLRPWPNN